MRETRLRVAGVGVLVPVAAGAGFCCVAIFRVVFISVVCAVPGWSGEVERVGEG